VRLKIDSTGSILSANHLASLLQFVETVNRLGYTDLDIARELVSFHALGLSWPEASEACWMQLIESAVSDGTLKRSEAGIVSIPSRETVKQLELFK
jgi:hypothetical protein